LQAYRAQCGDGDTQQHQRGRHYAHGFERLLKAVVVVGAAFEQVGVQLIGAFGQREREDRHRRHHDLVGALCIAVLQCLQCRFDRFVEQLVEVA
jgi:hypothetical protein